MFFKRHFIIIFWTITDQILFQTQNAYILLIIEIIIWQTIKKINCYFKIKTVILFMAIHESVPRSVSIDLYPMEFKLPSFFVISYPSQFLSCAFMNKISGWRLKSFVPGMFGCRDIQVFLHPRWFVFRLNLRHCARINPHRRLQKNVFICGEKLEEKVEVYQEICLPRIGYISKTYRT